MTEIHRSAANPRTCDGPATVNEPRVVQLSASPDAESHALIKPSQASRNALIAVGPRRKSWSRRAWTAVNRTISIV
jgi:hypothetical protein